MFRSNARMECPRCSATLEERTDGKDVIYGCVECGGVWLDAEQTSRILEGLEDRSPLLRLSSSVADDSPMLATTRPIPLCPIDREPLDLCEARGIQIDMCPHGTWFDAYELKRIVSTPASPPSSTNASLVDSAIDALFESLEEAKRRRQS